MSDGVVIALIGLVGVFITAVVAPPVVAIVNHLIASRNATKQKGLDVAKAQDQRIKAQERTIRALRRQIRLLKRGQRPSPAPHRPTSHPARKGDRP